MAEPGMSGGDRLSAILDGMSKRLGARTGAKAVRVGFLEGSTGAEGKPLPMIAAINEFGAPSRGQPPRPFFRRMIEKHQHEWGDQLSRVLVAQDYDATKALGQMGEVIKGELQQSIIDLVEPKLAAATIARKGFDKPLIETGTMLQRVDYEVVG